MALAISIPLGNAQAAKSTFSVLYTFTGGDDGAYPYAGLISDEQGNLYGTATEHGADGAGTVFKLAPNGTQSVLLTFDGTNGGNPDLGNLVADSAGNFYGTTIYGGNGYGNVYKLAPGGTETVLYNFLGGTDGRDPWYGLVEDKDGTLYGTTVDGGANDDGGVCGFGCGTVFKVSASGTETVLYSFCSVADCTDGSNPLSQLIIDKSGDLYGSTIAGGTSGVGNLFKLAPDGTESVLYSFCSQAECTDGCVPAAGVIVDKSGNFYGTTEECGPGGDGTVFKIAPDGTETVLHAFSGGNDGAWSFAALVEDKDGNLYGTTRLGGAGNYGIVFAIAPNGTETILHTFTGGNDGAYPVDALYLKGDWLYGTAAGGGADGYGTVFKVKK